MGPHRCGRPTERSSRFCPRGEATFSYGSMRGRLKRSRKSLMWMEALIPIRLQGLLARGTTRFGMPGLRIAMLWCLHRASQLQWRCPVPLRRGPDHRDPQRLSYSQHPHLRNGHWRGYSVMGSARQNRRTAAASLLDRMRRHPPFDQVRCTSSVLRTTVCDVLRWMRTAISIRRGRRTVKAFYARPQDAPAPCSQWTV